MLLPAGTVLYKTVPSICEFRNIADAMQTHVDRLLGERGISLFTSFLGAMVEVKERDKELGMFTLTEPLEVEELPEDVEDLDNLTNNFYERFRPRFAYDLDIYHPDYEGHVIRAAASDQTKRIGIVRPEDWTKLSLMRPVFYVHADRLFRFIWMYQCLIETTPDEFEQYAEGEQFIERLTCPEWLREDARTAARDLFLTQLDHRLSAPAAGGYAKPLTVRHKFGAQPTKRYI